MYYRLETATAGHCMWYLRAFFTDAHFTINAVFTYTSGPLAAIVTLTKGSSVAAGFDAFNRALKIKAERKE